MSGRIKHYDSTYLFTLPNGYKANGRLQKKGEMRPETVEDKAAMHDIPKNKMSSEYIMVVMLSRLIVKIGEVKKVTEAVIEGLDKEDFQYLIRFYQEMRRKEAKR